MRIGVSNIAWDVEEDEAVAALLTERGIDAIDVAPGKYFPDIPNAQMSEMQRVRAWWQARGVEITGMQALLFGTQGLNLFGSSEVQEAMLGHLRHVCRIGASLGATRLTFGSPKNRDRTGLTDETADEMAAAFFARLGDIAEQQGVLVCLEPNPERYGCNFMTTSMEAARMVERVGHPAIRLQLDTGALSINHEGADIIAAVAPHIGHIHLSEPDLVPLGDATAPHEAYAAALRSLVPDRVATVEMVATAAEPHLQSIARALKTAIRYYGNEP